MRSSYKLNNFEEEFIKLCKKYNPKSILEIGILDGYSLSSFIKFNPKDVEITAIDLFEDYEFNSNKEIFIKNNFKKYKNVKILKRNYYSFYKEMKNYDLIHIDISNDGDILEFAINNYLDKTNKVMLVEGGSIERDNVEWMIKYKKNPINPIIVKYSKELNIKTINKFPSLTIIEPPRVL